MLYIFYMHFTLIVSVFMLSICDIEINQSINQFHVFYYFKVDLHFTPLVNSSSMWTTIVYHSSCEDLKSFSKEQIWNELNEKSTS